MDMIYRNDNTRLKWIDIAKGIAIILVVIGHMLRGFVSAGMYEEYREIIEYIDFTIYSFHMPIFFIISGILYKKTTNVKNLKEYLLFIKKKILTLLIPYFVFSWMQIGIKLIMSGSVNSEVRIENFYTIIFKPIEQFWFLYALLFIFIIVAFIDYIFNDRFIKNIMFLSCFLLSTVFGNPEHIINQIFSNIIYFYIGVDLVLIKNNINRKNYGRVRSKVIPRNKRNSICLKEQYAIPCILLLYIILNLVCYNNSFNSWIVILEKFLLAILGSCFVITICKINENKKNIIIGLLKLIGKNSFSIYMLHIIFGAGIRIILIKMSIYNFIVQSVIGLLFAIFIPIILSEIYTYIKLKLNGKVVVKLAKI